MLYTINTALRHGANNLVTVSDSAKLDSQILLAHVLNKAISYLFTWPDQELTPKQQAQYLALLARREQGEPIAYIVGYKEFWSLELLVSPATLIPRPDTEVLVELVLENHPQEQLSCLDLGTGTGAIALALASERPNWQIDAIDFSDDAVALARENAQRLSLPQVSIYQSSWFDKISEQQSFKVIVSNPPYIDCQDHHLSEGDVRFEPHSALVAADDGLADIAHIIEQAKAYLAPSGSLYFEHGYQQAKAVRELFAKQGYHDIHTVKDYGGNDRITYACYN